MHTGGMEPPFEFPNSIHLSIYVKYIDGSVVITELIESYNNNYYLYASMLLLPSFHRFVPRFWFARSSNRNYYWNYNQTWTPIFDLITNHQLIGTITKLLVAYFDSTRLVSTTSNWERLSLIHSPYTILNFVFDAKFSSYFSINKNENKNLWLDCLLN